MPKDAKFTDTTYSASLSAFNLTNTTASYTANGAHYYTKFGNLVIIHICMQIGAMSAGAGIGYLPSGIRPKNKIGNYCAYDIVNRVPVTFSIATDGKISVDIAVNTGCRVELNVAYSI